MVGQQYDALLRRPRRLTAIEQPASSFIGVSRPLRHAPLPLFGNVLARQSLKGACTRHGTSKRSHPFVPQSRPPRAPSKAPRLAPWRCGPGDSTGSVRQTLIMPLARRDLIDLFGRACDLGNGAPFVGAGLSMGARLPSWGELLEAPRAESEVPAIEDLDDDQQGKRADPRSGNALTVGLVLASQQRQRAHLHQRLAQRAPCLEAALSGLHRHPVGVRNRSEADTPASADSNSWTLQSWARSRAAQWARTCPSPPPGWQ